MKPVKLLLVTGTPRSGSTAVGINLSLPRGVGILYEPFSMNAGMIEIHNHFEIPGTEVFPYYLLDSCVKNLEYLNLKLKSGVFPKDTGLQRWIKIIFGGRSKFYYRLCKLNPFLHTVIWKDPLASFAVEHLVSKHNIDVLVTYRNPWAVAASFKRLGWAFDLQGIQARLSEVNINTIEIPANNGNINIHASVINAAILWNMINAVLLDWKRKYPAIQFVNLDSIVNNPLQAYELIYEKFNLDFNQSVKKKIAKNYANKSEKLSPDSNQTHDWNRNILSVNNYWSNILTDEEVSFIELLNGNLWQSLQLECLCANNFDAAPQPPA